MFFRLDHYCRSSCYYYSTLDLTQVQGACGSFSRVVPGIDGAPLTYGLGGSTNYPPIDISDAWSLIAD